jgi:GNAT superfamily N-acetyltransferase
MPLASSRSLMLEQLTNPLGGGRSRRPESGPGAAGGTGARGTHSRAKSPGMSVEVRPAVVADVPALLDLYQQLSGGLAPEPPLTVAEADAKFAGIAADPDRTVLVATVDGVIAGTVDLLIVRPSLTHGGRPWAAVENVVVDDRHHRRGVGRALMEEAARRAREADCHRLQLLSSQRRTEAHAFYRAIGMDASPQGFRLFLE